MKAIVVYNSWSRRYAPHTRGNMLPVRIIRRQKATPEGTCTHHQVCCIAGGALGLEKVSKPIIATTWSFSRQTLFGPLTVTGASASCFFERYQDALSQSLDESNSSHTSTDCCTTVVCKQLSYRRCACPSYSVLGTPAYMLYVVMWNQTL